MYKLVSNEFDFREQQEITYICYGISKDEGTLIIVSIFHVNGQNQPMYIAETSECLNDKEIKDMCRRALFLITQTGEINIEGFNLVS